MHELESPSITSLNSMGVLRALQWKRKDSLMLLWCFVKFGMLGSCYFVNLEIRFCTAYMY